MASPHAPRKSESVRPACLLPQLQFPPVFQSRTRNKGQPEIRVSPQQGRGGGLKTRIRVKPGIRVSEDGGGSEIFYMRIKELFFFPCPCLTPIVSDIQYDLNEEKVQKVAKNMRSKCSLTLCIAGFTPSLSSGTVLCTHKRDFATVTLNPGRCFDRGGIGFYNNGGEEPNQYFS